MARNKIDPPKGGVGSVANKASKDATKKIAVKKEIDQFVNQGGFGENPGAKRFSDTKTLSDETLEKLREGNYDNETKPIPKHEKPTKQVISDLKLGLEKSKEKPKVLGGGGRVNS